MSDFKIDDIGKLNDFATMIGKLVEYWFGTDAGGGARALDDVLVPDPLKFHPNIGQLTQSGDLSKFDDAIDLYNSYDSARRALVGDPGQFAKSPTSSSLAAFVDGLNHLQATALAIYQNYDAAKNDDKLSVDQITALLNAPPQQTPPTG